MSDRAPKSARAASPAATGSERGGRPSIEAFRLALAGAFGAERRLRGRDHSRPGQLTYAQIRALKTLASEREMTAGQLAKSADLNPATVTAMLDHLEAANVVQRHRSTEDRRVCNVSLTPEGWQLLERKLAGWQALWEEQLEGFSDDEVDAAARVIHQVSEMYDLLAARLGSTDAQPGN